MLKKIKKIYLVVIELIITIALSMITEETYHDVIVVRGHYTMKTWVLVITTFFFRTWTIMSSKTQI